MTHVIVLLFGRTYCVKLFVAYLSLRDMDLAVTSIIDVVCQTLNCDRASIWMIDENAGEAWTRRAAVAGFQELRELPTLKNCFFCR
jgi:hypothetical protein